MAWPSQIIMEPEPIPLAPRWKPRSKSLRKTGKPSRTNSVTADASADPRACSYS
jgi:hypothetical protein